MTIGGAIMSDYVETLKQLLQEARDDLAAYIDQLYPHRDKYPHLIREYKTDMGIVRRIDAALAIQWEDDDE